MAVASRSRRRPPETTEEGNIDDVLVKLYRCATVVKGGRRFSFGALVAVGDRQGRVGWGYGKANEVPPAVDKGIKQARRTMFEVPLRGTTIPHRVLGRFGASKIALIPASEGTGVIAGSAARAVLELAGVKDVLTKSYGSTCAKNLVKATINGLRQLRSRAQVERLRGVKLDLPPEPEPAEPMEAYVDERPDEEQPEPPEPVRARPAAPAGEAQPQPTTPMGAHVAEQPGEKGSSASPAAGDVQTRESAPQEPPNDAE
jgi:small subunit ribosomal protein S5